MADIKDEARGRWPEILGCLGFDPATLCNRHGPCPLCGGKDRFRFDDWKGEGRYICNACGPGSGIDLVMKRDGQTFAETASRIRRVLNGCPASPFRIGVEQSGPAGSSEDGRVRVQRQNIWERSRTLEPNDPVDVYLRNRGLDLDELPSTLRYRPANQGKGRYAAMHAVVQAPDNRAVTFQYTFIDDGRKAPVSVPRQYEKGAIPKGSAVRLAKAGPTLGIAEGIETALAAQILSGVPTWAALDAGKLRNWAPPDGTEHVVVFADNDPHRVGQESAETLIERLEGIGIDATMRMPPSVGTDWADLAAIPSLRRKWTSEFKSGVIGR